MNNEEIINELKLKKDISNEALFDCYKELNRITNDVSYIEELNKLCEEQNMCKNCGKNLIKYNSNYPHLCVECIKYLQSKRRIYR